MSEYCLSNIPNNHLDPPFAQCDETNRYELYVYGWLSPIPLCIIVCCDTLPVECILCKCSICHSYSLSLMQPRVIGETNVENRWLVSCMSSQKMPMFLLNVLTSFWRGEARLDLLSDFSIYVTVCLPVCLSPDFYEAYWSRSCHFWRVVLQKKKNRTADMWTPTITLHYVCIKLY